VWVVKAQIHAGGRGKGGGVKVAKSIDDVRSWPQILGMQLVTHQTGPKARRSVACTSKKAPTSRRNTTCRW
jgi:succinyl-CoA synthetase beta subunit